MSRPELNVGVLTALSPEADPARWRRLAQQLIDDTTGAFEDATGARWHLHLTESLRLRDDETRRPADFLDEASLQMVEGPFDYVLVITDVGLSAQGQAVVAGLASPTARIAVLSTRKLLITPRGRPVRTLEDEAVRWNAGALAMHLMGHLLGLDHSRSAGDVMAPFAFDDDRRRLPGFREADRRELHNVTGRLPERVQSGGTLRRLLFHLTSAARHPLYFLTTLWRNRALLLPLFLPSLATAAVAPTFILIFTAEIWDVGLNMTSDVAWIFGILNVVAATWYLTFVQDLFFPRKEKRRITEHMALVNTVIFSTILLAMVGLFAMVGLLMLFIVFYIFPPGLMATWPTLEDPIVDIADRIRLAGFISAVGVLTGALAGGLESRTVIRHLALFLREP